MWGFIKRNLSPTDKIKETQIHDKTRRPSAKIFDRMKHAEFDKKHSDNRHYTPPN